MAPVDKAEFDALVALLRGKHGDVAKWRVALDTATDDVVKLKGTHPDLGVWRSTVDDAIAKVNNPAWFKNQMLKGDVQWAALHSQAFKMDYSAIKFDEKGLTIFGRPVFGGDFVTNNKLAAGVVGKVNDLAKAIDDIRRKLLKKSPRDDVTGAKPDAAFEALEKRLKGLQNDITGFGKQLVARERELGTLKDALKAHKGEIKDVKDVVKAHNLDTKKLLTEATDAGRKLDDAKSTLKAAQQETKKTEQAVADMAADAKKRFKVLDDRADDAAKAAKKAETAGVKATEQAKKTAAQSEALEGKARAATGAIKELLKRVEDLNKAFK